MMKEKELSEGEKQYQKVLGQEKELRGLIRQYFVLAKSCDHEKFSIDRTLLRGQRVTDVFLNEYENILINLTRADAPGRRREDERLFDDLASKLMAKTSWDEKVHKQKVYLKELDMEMKLVKKEVVRLQNFQCTDKQHEERVWHAMKIVEALENKLEAVMIQFGKICTKNKQLREEIDHHLWQRQIFIKQWSKIIDKLTRGKKFMLDTIEQATLAYNQREEWCTKLDFLRDKATHDLSSNIEAMREYMRQYDKNSKLKEFFYTKGQKRMMVDLEIKIKNRWKTRTLNLESKISYYKKLLDEIEEFAKEPRDTRLAAKFVKQEEINMSNFRYVIDILRESEYLGDRLYSEYQEIDEQYVITESRALKQKSVLEKLEYEFEDREADAKVAKVELNQTEDALKGLLQGVSTLFQLCKCNKDPLLKLLGSNNDVHFYNVDLYLKILESTIHQLLIAASDKDNYRKPEDPKRFLAFGKSLPQIYGIDKIVTATPCSLCVEHETVSDVIDVLQCVLSRSEAAQKLNRRLKLPGGKARLHTVSHCQLPKARHLIQRRYE